ncbi:MAG TPA: ABC transporter permease [Chitinophagaceae bacterium]
MIKSYLKIAFRNLWRHRVYSVINIAGLAAGLSAAFLIFLFVRFELSYDRFNVNADRIYRIACDVKTSTQLRPGSKTSEPMAPGIKNNFAEVENFVRLAPANMVVRRGNVKFQEDHILFADSSLFSVFTLPMIKGNPKTALVAPFSVVLTETTAKKYFGNQDPVGQVLMLTLENHPATVTGVIKDIPGNSHFTADIFISAVTLTQVLNPDMHKIWNWFAFYSYILLKKGADPKHLQAKFPAFLEENVGKQMKSGNEYFILTLEPLRDIYLRSERDSPQKGNLASVYIFSVIAAFILFIACINFINLTTARASERAKEIGVRKLIGAARKQLTVQFLGESLLHCLVAFWFAILFCELLLPVFNGLAGKSIGHSVFDNSVNFWLLFLVSAGVGLTAGFYPALVLSAFRPLSVVRGRFMSTNKGSLLRKILVVSQFTVSIVLIIATITVYTQIRFMLGQDLGFKKDQTIVIDYRGDERILEFQQKLRNIPQIQSTTLSSSVPGFETDVFWTEIEGSPGKMLSGEMKTGNVACYNVDFDFLKQYDIKIIAGRGFSKDFATDCPHAMVINEAALAQFEFNSPGEAIGRRFDQGGRDGTVIGVMKDFHFEGLQQKIKPLTMRIEPDGGRCKFISIQVAQKDMRAAISGITKTWTRMLPDRPFSYSFLDEDFNRQYQANDRFGKLFLYFAILGILISCLGLLGLSSYSTFQRTKEIGIRKVFGASAMSIVRLLTRNFLKLVIISFVVAIPAAWLAMQKWLQDFAYRTQLSWWIFLLAGVSALLIATLTVGYQAIKASIANPVKSLRAE